LRYLTRGGELRWVEARVRRQDSGFIASLGDISSQMLLRQSLQARHRSLSNLLDGLPLMAYRCRNNRHWSMEYVSAGCLALTGYSPEQLIDSQSLTFNSLIHPEDRENVWRAVQLGVDELQVFSIEYRLLCSDGSEKRVLERGCGIYSDAGDPLGLEGVVLELL
jgi:PAS domain S-box-containing protein